jgi:hypothetical protein
MNKTCRSSARPDNRRTDEPSFTLARDRAPQLRGGSNGYTFKRLGISMWGSGATQRQLDAQNVSNQRLLEWLEAENAELRGSVIELALQIQALRDGTETLAT